jgi:hypothetical protein
MCVIIEIKQAGSPFKGEMVFDIVDCNLNIIYLIKDNQQVEQQPEQEQQQQHEGNNEEVMNVYNLFFVHFTNLVAICRLMDQHPQ